MQDDLGDRKEVGGKKMACCRLRTANKGVAEQITEGKRNVHFGPGYLKGRAQQTEIKKAEKDVQGKENRASIQNQRSKNRRKKLALEGHLSRPKQRNRETQPRRKKRGTKELRPVGRTKKMGGERIQRQGNGIGKEYGNVLTGEIPPRIERGR